MKIGLLGHGTVGAGVDHIIRDRSDMEVTKVLSLAEEPEIAGRMASIDEITGDPEIDTVVEVMGGVHPASDFVLQALRAGKNVVTANKAVVAARGEELLKAAKDNSVSFRCTAAAGGSIPWLVNLSRAAACEEITELGGIMNGTTNFILDSMTRQGRDFEEVLQEAMRSGYAEKDPSADIDGPDIRRKLCISAEAAFGKFIEEETIPVFGIRYIKKEDIAYAAERGFVIKLLAEASLSEGVLSAFVEPVFVKNTELIAHVPANVNLVFYTGRYSGTQCFTGQGAGRYPTAYNVVQDLIDIKNAPKGSLRFYGEISGQALPDNTKVLHPYYFRTSKGVTVTEPMSVTAAHEYAEVWRREEPDLFTAGIF